MWALRITILYIGLVFISTKAIKAQNNANLSAKIIKEYLTERVTDTVLLNQYDGTKLSIVGIQTKVAAYTETIDGYTIIINPFGFYEIAQINKAGELFPSGLVAKNPDERTKKESKKLKKIPLHLRYSGDKLYYMIAKDKEFYKMPPQELRDLINKYKVK